MRLRNRHGSHVDPVPFVVVAGLTFMILLSFGPLYGQALGLSIETAIALSGALFAVATVVAFHRQVWCGPPGRRRSAPSRRPSAPNDCFTSFRSSRR